MKNKRGKGERIRSESICRVEKLLKKKREKRRKKRDVRYNIFRKS